VNGSLTIHRQIKSSSIKEDKMINLKRYGLTRIKGWTITLTAAALLT
jgi:hypothetical protein